jgi:hypothetical protein
VQDYFITISALTLICVNPFICIALALSLSIGCHKAINRIASVASLGFIAEKASNYTWTRILDAFAFLRMIIFIAFGATIFNVATDTFLEIYATKSAAFFL